MLKLPIDASVKTVRDLAEERASTLGITYSEGSVLWTASDDPLMLFDDDSVTEYLDDTEERTFFLGTTRLMRTTDGATSSLNSTLIGDDKVYVRWITPKQSLQQSKLGRINAEPVAKHTTIFELRHLAQEKLAGDDVEDAFIADLYLTHCRLSTLKEESTTLADLELVGSVLKPLDIFVCTVGASDISETPFKDCLAFECTERSIATFATSLMMLHKAIDKRHADLGNVLQVLWEITHFPPAVMAFQELHQNRIKTKGNRTSLDDATEHNKRHLAILAHCFWELAKLMVPPWISGSPDTVLEASRQIFAWICQCRPEATTPYVKLVRVEIREVPQDQTEFTTSRLGAAVDFQIPSRSDKSQAIKVLVASDSDCSFRLQRIAVILDGAYGTPWDYCFDLTEVDKLLRHSRVQLPGPTEFDDLLWIANTDEAFRMYGPLQIGSCLSTNLPVITLDARGFVSLYQDVTQPCEEVKFGIWNAVTGCVDFPDPDPGQYLLQKLEPIIEQRKKSNSWEVDAWADLPGEPDISTPDECIVICVDKSASMSSSMGAGWNLEGTGAQDDPSRLDVVKDMFTNLVTRISAARLAIHLGLVTFSSPRQIEIAQPLTGVLLNFQNKLDGIREGSNTAIWDALGRASAMLMMARETHQQVKCRIILLTDGQNNSSERNASAVCQELFNNDIVLDAIVIGTKTTEDLFKMALHTGGYAFAPRTRSLLYQIPMLETVIDIRSRPDIVKVPIQDYYLLSQPKTDDMASMYEFPPARPHPHQDDDFVDLRGADRYLRNTRAGRFTPSATSVQYGSQQYERLRSPSPMNSPPGSITFDVRSLPSRTTSSGASGLGRLVHGEVKAVIDNPHESMDVYVSERNMGFWKVAMQGPTDSPYANGTFILIVDIGNEFPRRAPTVRFITPILHANVSKVWNNL